MEIHEAFRLISYQGSTVGVMPGRARFVVSGHVVDIEFIDGRLTVNSPDGITAIRYPQSNLTVLIAFDDTPLIIPEVNNDAVR